MNILYSIRTCIIASLIARKDYFGNLMIFFNWFNKDYNVRYGSSFKLPDKFNKIQFNNMVTNLMRSGQDL